jgi:hypothetical protein
MFRALHVPAGENTIEFRYHPGAFHWAVTLFVGAAFA